MIGGEAKVPDEWFEYLRQLGERPDFAFGRIAGDGSITWYDYGHEANDGAGAFAEHLEKLDYQLDRAPPRAKFPRPGRLAMLRALLRRRVTGVPYLTYQEFDTTVPPPAPRAPVMMLTAEETRKLNDVAKAKGVSLNSIMLHALDQSVTPFLSRPNEPHRWGIPVSLRGTSATAEGRGNYVSFIGCCFKPGASVQDVHAAIRTELAANAQWANLFIIRSLVRLGPRLFGALIRQARKKRRYWTGNFSNIGPWDPLVVPAGDEDVAWCAAPPGMVEAPVSAVVIIWRGRVCATVMMHPGIYRRDDKAEWIVRQWREKLLAATS